MAALAAYPDLACTPGPFEVATQWGVFDDVFCAGNDSVFTVLEDVLTEVIALFPGQYIHIGGDEAPRRDTTLDGLAGLKPAFQKDGKVTAGNAPLKSCMTNCN